VLILKIHNIVALLLFVVALAAIFVPVARRYVVYVLALQIVLGITLWLKVHLVAPPAHWILAILVGGVWPMANALERKGRPKAAVMAITAVGALIVALVIYIGTHAAKAMGLPG
jgi:hypothetical protein